MQCFQKDPNLRVSARKLLKHNWIVGCRRSDAPVAKSSANFSQAVDQVKQWNKALTSDSNNLRASIGSDSAPQQNNHQSSRLSNPDLNRSSLNIAAKGPLSLAKSRPSAEDFRSPELAGTYSKAITPFEVYGGFKRHDSTWLTLMNRSVTDDDNWDDDFATAISPAALQLPLIKPQDHFGGMLSADRLKQFASMDHSRDISASWDDDYDGDLVTVKKSNSFLDEDPQEKTIRPGWKLPSKPEKGSEARSFEEARPSRKRITSGTPRQRLSSRNLANKFELPSRPDLAYREQPVEDYSDLFDDDQGDFLFNKRVSPTKKPNIQNEYPEKGAMRHVHQPQPDAPQLFHPSDLTSLPRSTQSSAAGSVRRQAALRPSLAPDRPMQRSKSSIEIQKFAESEGDEDFSDIFGPGDSILEKDESDQGSEDGGLMVLSKISNNSWLGDDEDEDDPFASMDPGWDEMDLEANIARDRHARLAEKVEELVRSLKRIEGEDKLSQLSEDLVSQLPNEWDSYADVLQACSPMGKLGGKGSHHKRAWPAADPGDSRAMYGEEPAAYDITIAEGGQYGKEELPVSGRDHTPDSATDYP